ncbi:hypothetical protein QFW77_01275, partial [Luteimonas sp. RD2P54]
AALGVAASLALAVGIAWQLRPQPEPFPAAPPDETPRGEIASIARDDPARAQAARPRLEVPREADAPDRQPPPAPAARPAPADTAAPRPDAPSAVQAQRARMAGDEREAMQARGEELRRQAARRREIAPAPAPVPVPVPPAPPAPSIDAGVAAEPERARSAPASATDTAIGRERVRGSAVTAQSVGDQRDPADLGVLESAPIEERTFHDQPLDDAPPATADSPRVHRAWLARIRELRDEGELEAARDSLREFHRRHPEVALPDDLAGLLDE